MNFQHKTLAEGRWHTFSLAEQLGNIGSEISRAIKARGDAQRYENAITRAFELLYLTIQDKRWFGRLKELTRIREVLCDEDLDRYFYYFAYAARNGI